MSTPEFDESITFFTKTIGLHESGRDDRSTYLHAWRDYQRFTLKLTHSDYAGLGHVAFRAKSIEVLLSLVESLKASGATVDELPGGFGHGISYRFADPDGHQVELYYDVEKFLATGKETTPFKNMPQRYTPHGIAPKTLDI